MKRTSVALAGLALVAAACTTSSEPEAATTTEAPPQATTTEQMTQRPATFPAEVVFEAQTSDGSTIVVASVTLPASGFVAVRSNSDGKPGPVIGHSELLPVGTSTDVVITLDQPLEATGLVFPMVRIDMDGDGEYTFMPPDNAVDIPLASGEIVVDQRAWGTEVVLELDGLPPAGSYSAWAIDEAGNWHQVATWGPTPNYSVVVTGASSLNFSDLDRIVVTRVIGSG
ncbi:MAG: hypothetical protein ACE5F5_02910 [Acidimicrobiia bacterium]